MGRDAALDAPTPGVDDAWDDLVADAPEHEHDHDHEERPKCDPVVHLHNHDEHSSFDGLQRFPQMFKAAAADGQPAIAITDHGNVSGAVRAVAAAKKAGIGVVLGSEYYVSIGSRLERNTIEVDDDDDAETDADEDKGTKQKVKRYEHLTVLAANQEGWLNLSRLSSESYLSGYWYKPRIDVDLLAAHGRGLIVMTGCVGGPIAGRLSRGDIEGADRYLGTLVEAVGRDNVYVEIMDHGIPAQLRAIPGLVELARRHDLPLVATNDAHYVGENEGPVHDAWLCAGIQRTIDDTKRFRFKGHGHHLRSSWEMRELFDSHDGTRQACNNTLAIWERVASAGRVLPDPTPNLPIFPVPETYDGVRSFLREQAFEGAAVRYGTPLRPDVIERLDFELDTIAKTGFDSYFLIVADMCSAARRMGIRVGPGRGSAAGSVVSYCLGIVQIDPIEYDLLFERFLSPDRIAMPDIDSDFEQGRRDEVIQYLRDRWGEEQVAHVGTFQTMRSKAAVKAATRVLGIEPTFADKLNKVMPRPVSGKPVPIKTVLDPTFAEGVDIRTAYESDPTARKVIDLALGFEGIISGESVHASAVLVTNGPVIDSFPVRVRAKDGVVVTQWDGPDIEEMGGLKLDILGLRNLDVITAALQCIKDTTGEDIDIDHVTPHPADQRAARAWAMLGRGETSGVFQLECVSGDTIIDGRRIEDLWAQQEAGGPAQRLRSANFEEGQVFINGVRGVVKTGRKTVFRLTTGPDQWIEATAGHRFMTGDGWMQLEGVRVGDLVMVEVGDQPHGLRRVHSGCPDAPAAMEWRTVAEIAEVGETETYDVAMEGPAHNYIANGFVVHNSGGMQELCRALRPNTLHDLAALVALYRPGPMSANMHFGYADRKNGRAPVDYDWATTDPDEIAVLERVLGRTYGLMIYQESSMLLAQFMGGYTKGQADELRKTLGKKLPEKLAALEERFMTGAVKEIRDDDGKVVKIAFREETARKVWDVISGGAAYLFNASHSAAYAQVTWQTAWLKANFPIQFASALLAVTDDDDRRNAITSELRAGDITISTPSINTSRQGTSPRPDIGAVVLGLGEIKGLGDDIAQAIVAEREESGPYSSLVDMCQRLDARGVKYNKTHLDRLILSGAVDEYGSRFGHMMVAAALREGFDVPIPKQEWRALERLALERSVLGTFASMHPLTAVQDQLANVYLDIAGGYPDPVSVALSAPNEAHLVILGVITTCETKTSKAGNKYTRFVLEGSAGGIECFAYSRTLERLERDQVGHLLRSGTIVAIRGRVRIDEDIFEPDRGGDDEDLELDTSHAEPKRQFIVETALRVPIIDPEVNADGSVQTGRPTRAERRRLQVVKDVIVDTEVIVPAPPVPAPTGDQNDWTVIVTADGILTSRQMRGLEAKFPNARQAWVEITERLAEGEVTTWPNPDGHGGMVVAMIGGEIDTPEAAEIEAIAYLSRLATAS